MKGRIIKPAFFFPLHHPINQSASKKEKKNCNQKYTKKGGAHIQQLCDFPSPRSARDGMVAHAKKKQQTNKYTKAKQSADESINVRSEPQKQKGVFHFVLQSQGFSWNKKCVFFSFLFFRNVYFNRPVSMFQFNWKPKFNPFNNNKTKLKNSRVEGLKL